MIEIRNQAVNMYEFRGEIEQGWIERRNCLRIY